LLGSRKSEALNPKWFDQPFDRLRVPSRVEGLTTLSHVEGQYPMIQIQMTKTVGRWVSVLNIDELVRSQKMTSPVIPAKAGIQEEQSLLDPGFHRGDGLS
jgi:hypothetical protein